MTIDALLYVEVGRLVHRFESPGNGIALADVSEHGDSDVMIDSYSGKTQLGFIQQGCPEQMGHLHVFRLGLQKGECISFTT